MRGTLTTDKYVHNSTLLVVFAETASNIQYFRGPSVTSGYNRYYKPADLDDMWQWAAKEENSALRTFTGGLYR